MKNLPIIIAASILLFTSCNLLDAVKGDKNIVKKEYAVSDFTAMNISTICDIEYKQINSDSAYVCIEIDSNLVQYLDIYEKDGQLIVETDKNQPIDPSKFIIYTNAGKINKITLSAVGDFTVTDNISTNKLDVSLTGVGDLRFGSLEVDTISARITGTGNIKLAGKATFSDFAVTGIGDIDSYEFTTKTAKCMVSGVGDIKVNATDSLASSVSGVGDIRYRGTPIVVNSISGIGRVKNTKK